MFKRHFFRPNFDASTKVYHIARSSNQCDIQIKFKAPVNNTNLISQLAHDEWYNWFGFRISEIEIGSSAHTITVINSRILSEELGYLGSSL